MSGVGVGIDIGAHSATIAAVRRRGGSLALEHYAHYPLEELTGGDDSPARVATALMHQVRSAGFSPRAVVLGVSGRDAIIRYSHLPAMPDWRLALLMEMEIADTSERTGEPLSADFRVLPSDGAGNLVLVALAKDARVSEAVAAAEAAGLEVGGAVPQPVAVGDCFRYLGDDPSAELTLVLDIGRSSTEIAIVEEGELIFARSVALGGGAFEERLQKALNLEPEAALECLASGKTPAGGDIDSLLAGPRNQLASMVRASLDFARAQLKRRNLQVGRAAVSGGGARIPGLVEAVGEALECPTALFDPLADLDAGRASREAREAAEAHGPEAATALGLALSAIIPGATRLDLLPLAVKQKLEFRHRTLWLYVSAAVLAAALLISFLLAFVEYSGQDGRRKALQTANAAVQARRAEHEERAADNEKREADLRALADRARPGFHLASLLRSLGELTPPEISFTEGTLVQSDTPGAFQFELRGNADDTQGRGVAAMRDLELALANEPLIAEAKVVPQGGDDGSLKRFRLTLVPTGNPSAEGGEGGR